MFLHIAHQLLVLLNTRSSSDISSIDAGYMKYIF